MKGDRRMGRTILARERGTVLFIALIVFVVLMLAGAALIRSMTGGTLVIGNLGTKQAATSAGDAGLEAARLWVNATGLADASRFDSNGKDWATPTAGYVATWGPSVAEPGNKSSWKDPERMDPAKAIDDWGKAFAVAGGKADQSGNVVRYVVHRMCKVPGAPAAAYDPSTEQQCVMAEGDAGGPQRSGSRPLAGGTRVYFRVTAQVTGPKNTVSYVQSMIR